MKRLIVLAIVLMCANVCSAQVNGQVGIGVLAPPSTTFEEGYLSGLAKLRFGTGMYLTNLGDYLIKTEQARALHGENWINGVKNRWEVRDAWKARNNNINHVDFIESRHRTLDLIERQAELKKREDDLIAKGLLPARMAPGITIAGVRYRTYDDYRKTDHYREMKEQQKKAELAAQIAEEEKEARGREAIRFLAMWDKMGLVEQQRYGQMSATEKAEYKKEFYDKDYQAARLQNRQDARFYETRPYLQKPMQE